MTYILIERLHLRLLDDDDESNSDRHIRQMMQEEDID